MSIASAHIDLVARDQRFNAAMDRVGATMKRVQAQMRKVARAARNMLLIGGAALVGLLAAASRLEESTSKLEAVFKGQADAAKKWVEEQSRALNRASGDLTDYMATLQDTFVPLGVARDKAFEMSKVVTKLGIDLASFNNKADSEVINNLTSALTGNNRAVRSYGIVLNQARVEQELLNQGLTGGIEAATEEEKAFARLAIILGATTDAQGDAVRTGKSFENQVKGLRADLLTLAQVLGMQFIPAFKEWITTIREVIPAIIDWVKQNGEAIVKMTKLAFVVGAVAIALPGLAGAIIGVTQVMKILTPVVKGLNAAMLTLSKNPLVAAMLFLAFAIGTTIAKVKAVKEAMKAAKKEMRDYAHEAQKLDELEEDFLTLTGVEEQTKNLTAQIAVMRKLASGTDLYNKAIADLVTRIETLQNAGIDEEESAKVLKLKQDMTSLTAKIKDMADTFGLSAEQADLFRIKARGAADLAPEKLKALELETKRLEDLQKAEKAAAEKKRTATKEESKLKALEAQAKSLKDQARTKSQILKDDLAEIEMLRKKKLLTEDEAAKLGGLARKRAQDTASASAPAFEGLTALNRRISSSAGTANKPENRTATNTASTARSTEKTEKSTKQSADSLRELVELFTQWLLGGGSTPRFG